MSRTRNTLFNASANFIYIIITKLIGFVSRTIFIHYLDSSYLGINGLYSNILSMLSLAELGIGTSIIYCLYKPLAQKDSEKIDVLMSFFRRSYTVIGITIAVIGTIVGFFLEILITDISSVEHYRLYYYLFLFNTVSTYLIAYKTTLISADQKGYKLTKYNLIFETAASMLQISALIIFRQYVFYLIVQICVATIQKIYINRFISREYPEISFHSKGKLDKEEATSIKKNVTAMFLQKIGGYAVFGTDNILIAYFVNVAAVGIYSNYSMLIDIINNIIKQLFKAVGSSVGNLTADGDKEREYKLFHTMYFINFCLSGFSSICFYQFLNPFIKIWIGDSYLLSGATVFVLVLNYYLTQMRKCIEAFYNANGLFWHGRYKSFIEAIINLGASIVLARNYGLLGVFIGTTISSVCTSVFYDSYILYKYGFKKSGKDFLLSYVTKYFVYMFVCCIVYTITSRIGNLIGFTNIGLLLLQAGIIFVTFLGVTYLCFGFIGSCQEYYDTVYRIKTITQKIIDKKL